MDMVCITGNVYLMVSLTHTDDHNYRPEFKYPQHSSVINLDLTIIDAPRVARLVGLPLTQLHIVAVSADDTMPDVGTF